MKSLIEEHASIQSQITDKIIKLGRVMNLSLVETMARLYAPLLSKSPREGVKVTKDEAYGPDVRNILDVYEPDNKKTDSVPILIFVHGGGFVMGDKADCKNIGYYFARNNVLTVIPSYRLAPKHRWPSGAEDLAAVLEWIGRYGTKFRGDTKRIFLMGHSAGAAHVSTYIFFHDLRLKKPDGVAGTILMSGPAYDTNDLMEDVFPYYGEDKSKYPDMSVISRVENNKIPVFIMFAEFDPPVFDYQSVALFNALFNRDNSAPFIKRLIKHNHISEVMHFNTGDDSVGIDILNFINSRLIYA